MLEKAYVQRFTYNCLHDQESRKHRSLESAEIQSALKLWILHSQEKTYGDEMGYLRNKEQQKTSKRLTMTLLWA